MGIKGLPIRLFEAGKIKIGRAGQKRVTADGKEWYQAEKLNNFIVVTCERGPDHKFILDTQVMKELGDTPKEVAVRLLSDDIDANFDNYYGVYVGRKCLCRGDGEKAVRRETVKEGRGLRLTGKEKTVPCGDACPFFRYRKDGNKPQEFIRGAKCKCRGKLYTILECSQRVGGVYIFRTSGRNSVLAILNSLNVIKGLASGFLAGLPLRLTYSKVQTHEADGTARTIPVVNIEYAGSIGELRQHALAVAQARAGHQLEMKKMQKLLANMGDTPADEAEHNAEFDPDSMEVEVLPADDTRGQDAQVAEYDEIEPPDDDVDYDGPSDEIPEGAWDKREPSEGEQQVERNLQRDQETARKIIESQGELVDSGSGEVVGEALTEGERKLMETSAARKNGKRRAASSF